MSYSVAGSPPSTLYDRIGKSDGVIRSTWMVTPAGRSGTIWSTRARTSWSALTISVVGEKSTLISVPPRMVRDLTRVTPGTMLTASSMGRDTVNSCWRAPSEVPLATIVTRVRSRTIRGGTEINVDFSPTTEMVNALQEVRARVDQIVPDLPAGVTIQVERMTPSLFPILSYNVEGGDPATLYDIARYQIKPIVSRVPGVGRVDVLGSDVREIEVVADPVRLAQQAMTFDDLAAAIREATTVTAVGRMPRDYTQDPMVSATGAHPAHDIANILGGHRPRRRHPAARTPRTPDRV